jgi:hypothetical protein
MCMISMVVDDYWKKLHPWKQFENHWPEVGRFEFDALKKEVEQLRRDLERAQAQDKKDGLSGCERDKADKHAMLKKLADIVGIDLSDILKGTYPAQGSK